MRPWADRTSDARLVDLLGGVLGRAPAHLAVAPSPFAGVWPASTASATLDDGATLALWVKRLSAAAERHPDKAAPNREPRVYLEVLAGRDLPVARCYGCARDAEEEEHVLVLEHVRDWDLRYHGLETWAVAVEALGQLHAAFAPEAEALAALGFLLQVDAGYVREWWARAEAALCPDGSGLSRRLAALADGRDEVASVIAAQPRTLVHNDLAPKNVVADTTVAPPRICVVDWETAGVGCGALDVVHLLHGLAPAAAERLIGFYARAASDLLPCEPERARVLAACRAHKTIHRLAHRALWHDRPALARAWLDDLEDAVGAL